MGISYCFVGNTTGEIIRVQHSLDYHDPIPPVEELPTSTIFSVQHRARISLPKSLWLKIYERFKAANPDGTEVVHENFDRLYYWPAYAKLKGWDVNDKKLCHTSYGDMSFEDLRERYAPELKDPEFVQELLKTAYFISDEPPKQPDEAQLLLAEWAKAEKQSISWLGRLKSAIWRK
jgi:hypothetical protein